MFGVNQVLFKIFQQLTIELQPSFQHAIGEALFPLEKPNDLIEKPVIVNHRPSTWASAAFA
jgi:hypothetical protein